ncbi:MAG: hypothetical protein ACYSXF_07870 [Planctomycetota bacterium]|jgi:hypothetical protein
MWIGLLPLLILVVLGGTAAAVPITVPADLNPGDQYRLVFVTSTDTQAGSTDIADYNAFVTAAANTQAELVVLGTTWTAIGSTAAVDARDNTGTNPSSAGVPIYLLDGATRIADSNADLWDGWLLAWINLDEGAAYRDTNVWTGTEIDGTAHLASLGFDDVIFGESNGPSGLTNYRWIINLNGAAKPYNPYALYGISGVLAVIPEPFTALLLASGLAALAGFRRR